jgi:hypothetical protein
VNSQQKKTLESHLTTHLSHVRATLALNQLAGNQPQLLSEQEQNYRVIQALLKQLQVDAVHKNVVDAATIIEKARPALTKGTLQISKPPPVVEVARELANILNDCAHSIDIDHIHVQLDNDQLKHQPASVPIGTRQTHGGSKFDSTATRRWHEEKTMRYMADWAASLTGLVEGKKVEHGQKQNVEGLSYEGFCVLLGGKRYVSFHCYPKRV